MTDTSIQQDKELERQRVVVVHFVDGRSLKLFGSHVPTFLENYKKAVEGSSRYFCSQVKDTVLIAIEHVTFIEEYDEELSS